jgi:hypothetical protein
MSLISCPTCGQSTEKLPELTEEENICLNCCQDYLGGSDE